MENDKVKDDFKINKTNTDLTSLTTVAQECLRTTELKVNNHPESSVQTLTTTDREYRITDSSTGENEFTSKVIKMDMPQKSNFRYDNNYRRNTHIYKT